MRVALRSTHRLSAAAVVAAVAFLALWAGFMTRDSWWFGISVVWPFALVLVMLVIAFA
jgi:hypothetical protein